ncbi:MAG: hypothetical protein NT084_15585 [Bacteroidetes bacterium]|nr:hypothetical protein [Bacteroidota bacterium]
MQNIPINACNDEMLNTAISNLQTNFISFGLMEKFDEGLILFKHALCWNANPFYKRLNVSEKRKDDLPEEVRREIEKRNYYDVALYNWASVEFNKRFSNIINGSKELDILKNQNVSFQVGFDAGFDEGTNVGFDKGYDYLLEKLFLLRLAKKIKRSFQK